MGKIVKGCVGVLSVFVVLGGLHFGIAPLLKPNSSPVPSNQTVPAHGSLKKLDLFKDKALTATLVGLYAQNLDDDDWRSLGVGLHQKTPIKMVAALSSNGAGKYHFVQPGQTENQATPWYRMAGTDLEAVNYFSANDKRLMQVELDEIVTYINQRYTDAEILAIKAEVTVQEQTQAAQTFAKELGTRHHNMLPLSELATQHPELFARKVMTYVEHHVQGRSIEAAMQHGNVYQVLLNQTTHQYALVLNDTVKVAFRVHGEELLWLDRHDKRLATTALADLATFLADYQGDLAQVEVSEQI